jgi:hypothetical protein
VAGEPMKMRLLRPEDLLVLDISMTNLAVGVDGHLHVVDQMRPGRIVFELPPQHIAEAAFQENETSSQIVSPLPVRSVSAGPTQLAFDVPADGPGLPFTIVGLLDWAALRPALAPNALPPGTPTRADGVRPAEPTSDVTALELVYRLVLSPVGDHGWLHRADPYTAAGVTELWHTRLTGADQLSLRAIYGRQTDPFLTSLSTTDIADLVTLTGDFGNTVKSARDLGIPALVWFLLTHRLSPLGRAIVPPPETLTAQHVTLTALGAHHHVVSKFDFPRDDQRPTDLHRLGITVPSVQAYEHITGLGRDQYVKVVKRGYLDTGHRASIVKITERRFEPVSLGTEPSPQSPVGIYGTHTVLRQYYRIVVTQPVLDYRLLTAGYPKSRREMPLRTIELRTLETPKIDLPISFTEEVTQDQIDHILGNPLWIKASGELVPFDFDSVDGEGRRVSMTKPMLFIPYSYVGNTDGVITTFNGALPADRTAAVRAQRLALTEPLQGKPDATTAAATYLIFDLIKVTSTSGLPRDYVPGWLPQSVTAGVHLQSLEQLTGSPQTVEVGLSSTYLDHGFDPGGNPASLFATYAEVPFGLGAAAGGGVAAPSVKLDALSATQGTMPSKMAAGVDSATLKSLLAGMKLFGTVDLADLLAPMPPPGPNGPAAGSDTDLDAALQDPKALIRAPVIRTRPFLGPDGTPNATVTRLVWKPALLTTPPVTPLFELGDAQFLLDVRMVTRLDGSPPETTVAGELRGFSLTLAGVVRVSMGTLTFVSMPGRKPDVAAETVGLEFVGALAFVDTIRQLLPADGFSDPPAITTTPEGIQAGFSLGIPTTGVGIFSLQNLSLSASLSLPFIGKPAGLRFALSSREHPFLVTVTLFGGGGFFALGVSAAGVEEIEAAIEFGGNVSLNLGVASGGVYVMAGIYFKMSTTQGTELTGYFRCGGYLEVLGLISISLEFYLAFTYRDKGGGRNEIWGQASLTVSVKVLCFSTSVKLSVEKRFAGPAGDPTLDQVLSADDWQAYCLAYAPEPAA